jgi:serine/threonine protein kinase
VSALGESGNRPSKLGRYELITPIGHGGMAEVQLAIQRGPAGFEKLVVVKLVHENLATQKAFVDMLLDEARVAALVKHPNVVDIYDLGEVDGRYFIAMEYLEGEPLLAVLRAGRDGQRLDVLSTARLVADTAEGLDAAHELRSLAGEPIGLVHHDVSLGNIVVLYNGQVKLVDFGVAKATQSATSRARVQGKFAYMAPEKLRGGPGDRRSDIWSLGCVLWEALTLRRLFKGGNDSDTMMQVLESEVLAPSKVNGDVPEDFDAITLRALDREPDRRYPTAKAMATELEDVLRKHGYAAKNDQIARYMQGTFASHIAARKKLLQEVSSKGRASPDVVEAAFHADAEEAARAPSHAEGTPRPAIEADEPAPSLAIASSQIALAEMASPPIEIGDGMATTIDLPALAEPGAEPGAEPAHEIVTDTDVDALPATSDTGPTRVPERPVRALHVTAAPSEPIAPLAAPTAPSRRWMLYPAVIAAGLAGLVIASFASRRAAPLDAPPAPALPPPAPAAIAIEPASPPPAAAPPALADAVTPGPDPAPTGAPPALAALGRPPGAAGDGAAKRPSPRRTPTKPAEKLNPGEVFKIGFQAWARGDTRTALASYKRVLAANPDYAPAWRGVGLVYEKLGDKPDAHNAFQKYLQLEPSATDAASIRARLESL